MRNWRDELWSDLPDGDVMVAYTYSRTLVSAVNSSEPEIIVASAQGIFNPGSGPRTDVNSRMEFEPLMTEKSS